MMGVSRGLSDEALCDLLLAKATLTDTQTTLIVDASVSVVAGGRLSQMVRNHFMSIASAQKLLKQPGVAAPRKEKAAVNLGDPYSAYRTKGTSVADEILKKGRTPSGKMLLPPGARRTG